jgi:hypothetical protein
LHRDVQQDPQEFSKLFLSKLEPYDSHIKDSNRLTLSQLLTGKLAYITTCEGIITVFRFNDAVQVSVGLNVDMYLNTADLLRLITLIRIIFTSLSLVE